MFPLVCLAFVLSWATARGRLRATLAGVSMFGICLFVAGLSHIYQRAFFDGVRDSTPDVALWHDHSRYGFNDEVPYVNAPFAVVTWRATYEMAAKLDLGDGVWIAIAVNACLMAATAALTVRTAGMIFAGDKQRMRFVTVASVLCPTFWMFGGMLVRDSFAVLIQTAVVSAVLHLVSRRVTGWRAFKTILLVAVLGWATRGIRAEMVYTFPVAAAIAIVAIGLQGRGLKRPGPVVAALVVVSLAGLTLADRFTGAISIAQQGYSDILTNYDFASSGLGNRLVVSQPLPIRVVVGTLYIHVFPVPFWYGFSFSAWDYHWLKSFSAVFMISLTPLAALGAWRALTAAMAGQRGTAPSCFAALYWPAMAAAVAVTSLETRHLGQFMPVFILLAAMRDLTLPADRRLFRWLGGAGYSGIAAGHAARRSW